jgi:DNA-directed RNA polymerase specialized sigma24 family protein
MSGPVTATSDDEVFQQLRPELFGIAYRMLGSASDAEDVVHEAYLRWRAGPRDDVRSPRAFLATVVTRLCIDTLSSARAQRESYVGPWLPEPLLVDEAGPAEVSELPDSLSLASLVLLEELKYSRSSSTASPGCLPSGRGWPSPPPSWTSWRTG